MAAIWDLVDHCLDLIIMQSTLDTVDLSLEQIGKKSQLSLDQHLFVIALSLSQ